MPHSFASTSARAVRAIALPQPSVPRVISSLRRYFRASPRRMEFHFDTHHFVQRLEREGLNRAQAEGIMSAMAEVIDESIRNMTSNMVTKADQEKVRLSLYFCTFDSSSETHLVARVAPLYSAGRLCAAEVRTPAHGEERARDDQGGERPACNGH